MSCILWWHPELSPGNGANQWKDKHLLHYQCHLNWHDKFLYVSLTYLNPDSFQAHSGELFTIDYTLTREILEQDQLAWWTKAMTQMWVNVLLSYDSYCILLFQVLLNMLGVICPYCEGALLLFQNCHNCNQKNPDTVRSKLFSVSKLSSVIIVFFCR